MENECEFRHGSQGLGPVFGLGTLLNGLPEAKFSPGFNAKYFNDLFYRYKVDVGTRLNAIFTAFVVVLGMVLQFLQARGTYREVISALAWLQTAWMGKTLETNAGSAFHRARMALSADLLKELVSEIATRTARHDANKRAPQREIVIMDGSTFTMADTEENQKEFPQPKDQKEGCGFPMLRAFFLLNYYTGMMEAMAYKPYSGKDTSENALFRAVVHQLRAGQILVADAIHCSYWEVAWSLAIGVDVVMMQHLGRDAALSEDKELAPGDTLWIWNKPGKPNWMTISDYQKLPSTIIVRIVEPKLAIESYLGPDVPIITTLLDREMYPAEAVDGFYAGRWSVETHINEVKTSLDRGHFRALTPDAVENEFWGVLLAYNCLRLRMYQAAELLEEDPMHMSFIGALVFFRENWKEELVPRKRTEEQAKLCLEYRLSQMNHVNEQRPGRVEPRKLKRRPKYDLLNMPRAQERKLVNEERKERDKERRCNANKKASDAKELAKEKAAANQCLESEAEKNEMQPLSDCHEHTSTGTPMEKTPTPISENTSTGKPIESTFTPIPENTSTAQKESSPNGVNAAPQSSSAQPKRGERTQSKDRRRKKVANKRNHPSRSRGAAPQRVRPNTGGQKEVASWSGVKTTNRKAASQKRLKTAHPGRVRTLHAHTAPPRKRHSTTIPRQETNRAAPGSRSRRKRTASKGARGATAKKICVKRQT